MGPIGPVDKTSKAEPKLHSYKLPFQLFGLSGIEWFYLIVFAVALIVYPFVLAVLDLYRHCLYRAPDSRLLRRLVVPAALALPFRQAD
jgi:hypothetical protein